MQKIMFNDNVGLTELVMEKVKKMTRRVEKKVQKVIEEYEKKHNRPFEIVKQEIIMQGTPENHGYGYLHITTSDGNEFIPTTYKVGEVVAIAESYEKIEMSFLDYSDKTFTKKKVPLWGNAKTMKGYHNKMFVRADMMPHHIKITNMRLERLQDISHLDCLKEGILDEGCGDNCSDFSYECSPCFDYIGNMCDGFDTPRKAFASLIDKVSGKGTWDSNPWVVVYSFELLD
jgi:hypothetical protein